MKSRPGLHQVLESIAQADEATPLVVATVLRAEGSTPLDAGAKAVIGAEGLIAGTIGGGALEGEALRRAAGMLGRPEAAVFDFALQGPGGTDPDPVCGGRMRILVHSLTGEDHRAYKAAWEALGTRTRGVLDTEISTGNSGAAKSRWLMGELDLPAQMALTSLRACHLPGVEGIPGRLIEPVVPLPVLLIVGAGHVGQALAAQAALAGFELAVIDDRADHMAPTSFPGNARLLCGEIPSTVKAFPLDADTFVVLATRGHYADGLALRHCLGRTCAYIGMIGSRRKVALMRQHFLGSGMATGGEFDRVFAPVGIGIGAETAPEIATSILAQIIAVRRGAIPAHPCAAASPA